MRRASSGLILAALVLAPWSAWAGGDAAATTESPTTPSSPSVAPAPAPAPRASITAPAPLLPRLLAQGPGPTGPALDPAGRPAAPPAATAVATPATDPAPTPARPFYKKWWFWTAVGVAAVVTTAVIVTRSDGLDPPDSLLGDRRAYED